MIDQDATPATEWAKKKRVIRWLAILVGLLLFVLAVKPTYHSLKTQRANQFAAAADQFVAAGKLNDAAEKYHAALQMDPVNYQALRGAARLATKAKRPEAAGLWEQVARLPQSTVEDHQQYAGFLINAGRLNLAEKILEPLLRKDPDAKTLLLASRFSQKSGDNPKAIEFARIAVKRAPDEDGPEFQLADLLAKSTNPAEQAEARKILWEFADKQSEYKNPAVEALARAPQLSLDEKKRVLDLLNGLPTKNIADDLLAADMRIQIQPDVETRVYDETIARWKSASPEQLVQLARWLTFHRQSDRVLSLFPLQDAFENNQLLLAHLDALAVLERWSDIDELLNRPEITLDPCVTESFRARTAAERGAGLDAEAHWNHAISLAGTEPEKLRFVANFAEESRAGDAAMKAYEALARFPEDARDAYLGMERIGRRTGDAKTEQAAAEKLAAASPDDPNAIARLVYLNLLLNRNVNENVATAKGLVEKYNDRLAYRVTAALGYLRQKDPASAMAQFNAPVAIEWKRTQPAWRAVYAATLAANGRKDDAREMIAAIPVDRLNAEERALIDLK